MSTDDKGMLYHFIHVGLGTFVSLLIGFCTTPIITRIVSPDEYGHYSMFLTYASLMHIAIGLGMDQALARFYYDSEEYSYKHALFGRCVYIPFWLSVAILIVVGVMLACGNFWGVSIDFQLLLIGIYIILLLSCRFLMLLLRLENKSKNYSFVNILQKLVYVVASVLLIILLRNNSSIMLCIGAIISQCICVVALVIMNRTIIFCNQSYNGKMVATKELLHYAFPFVFSMGVSSVFQALDRLFINKICGFYEVGIYSSAMSIIHVFAIVQTSFTTVWMPNAIRRYTENPKDKEYFKYVNQVITLIMFCMGIFIILSKDILVLLIGGKYRDAVTILPFLVFSPIMYTISETTVIGLTFKKKSRLQIIAPIIACCANFCGNYLLVPRLGGKGAAISTALSYIIFFIARTLLSNRYYYIDYSLTKILGVAFLTMGYATVVSFVDSYVMSLMICIIILIVLISLYKSTAVKIVSKFRKR